PISAPSGGPLPAASGRAVEPEEQLDYTPDVLLELPLVHGRRESDEQPEMGVALEQGEEVTRRVHPLVDAQLSPGAGLLQNQVHTLAYPLRTCLIEQLGQLGILPGHPYQQPVQGQRLGAVDQRAEGQPDPLQGLSDIALRRYTAVEIGQLRLTDQPDGSHVQCFLVLEMVVDRELGHTGLGGDRIHAGALVAIAQKQLLRCLQHRGTLGGVLGTPGTRSRNFRVRHILPILDWWVHYLYYTRQYTYSTLIQAHDHAPLSCFPWRHCPSLLDAVSLQRSTDGGRATPPGTGHPAPARQRPGTQLPRRGAGPPRTGTGVPHRRQGHPAPGRGRVSGEKEPAAGGTGSRGCAPAAGSGTVAGGCRRGQPESCPGRTRPLPHPAGAADDQFLAV